MADERKEFELIHRLFAPLAVNRPEAFGLLDDAAVLSEPAGSQRVVTTDCLVEGVHYRPDDPPGAVASRVLRSNLSDLAAMGARPDCYILALAMSHTCDDAWLDKFVRQLEADQNTYDISLIGGDTVATPGPMTITVTAMGMVDENLAIQRSTANDGDDVYVSGYIGDAFLGLSVLNSKLTELSNGDAGYLINRFWYPSPRIDLGASLSGSASAMADVSDGLIADLGHICDASGLEATVLLDDIPLSPAARNVLRGNPSPTAPSITDLLTGGDDYELVFTAPTQLNDTVKQKAQETETPVTKIGVLRSTGVPRGASPVSLVDSEGNPVSIDAAAGYEHQW